MNPLIGIGNGVEIILNDIHENLKIMQKCLSEDTGLSVRTIARELNVNKRNGGFLNE